MNPMEDPIPSTVLIDPRGREIGRVVGGTVRDTPEMIAPLRSLVLRP